MTVEEKRKRLLDYCDKQPCENCKLNEESVCRCGLGYGFSHSSPDGHALTDAEIIGAYQIMFDDDAVESCELDSAFECDGLHIVTGDNCTINIYKKEV